MKQRIFIQGLMAIAATAAVIVFHEYVFPHWTTEIWEEALDITGLFLLMNGFFLRVIARGYKAEASRQSQNLVTQGIYRLTRNPMYLGTFLIGLGFVMTALQWWLFLIFAGAFLVIYIPQMRKEKQWLLTHFGNVYIEYCQVTPQFFPKLSGWIDPRFWKELRFEWKWFWVELRAMVITVGVVVAIETWQDIHSFGIHEFLEEIKEYTLILVVILFFWLCLAALFKRLKISS